MTRKFASSTWAHIILVYFQENPTNKQYICTVLTQEQSKPPRKSCTLGRKMRRCPIICMFRAQQLILVLVLVLISTAAMEQSHEVVHRKFGVLDFVTTKSCRRKLTLLLLQSKNSLFDSFFNRQLVNVNVPCLSQAMCAIESLVLENDQSVNTKYLNVSQYLKSRVPPHIDQYDIVARGEIQALILDGIRKRKETNERRIVTCAAGLE